MQARSEAGVEAEDCRASASILARCQQFQRHVVSPWPVIVLRCNAANDYRLLYHAGVEAGQGTPDERREAMAFIEKVELYND